MTKIAAMIHRIVATPPPQAFAAINNSMCSSLPFRDGRDLPRDEPSQAFEAGTGEPARGRHGQDGPHNVDRPVPGSSLGAVAGGPLAPADPRALGAHVAISTFVKMSESPLGRPGESRPSVHAG